MKVHKVDSSGHGELLKRVVYLGANSCQVKYSNRLTRIAKAIETKGCTVILPKADAHSQHGNGVFVEPDILTEIERADIVVIVAWQNGVEYAAVGQLVAAKAKEKPVVAFFVRDTVCHSGLLDQFLAWNYPMQENPSDDEIVGAALKFFQLGTR